MSGDAIALSPDETARTGTVRAWLVVLPPEQRRLDERGLGGQSESGQQETDQGLAERRIIGRFEWHQPGASSAGSRTRAISAAHGTPVRCSIPTQARDNIATMTMAVNGMISYSAPISRRRGIIRCRR